jgi:hypothetical protein
MGRMRVGIVVGFVAGYVLGSKAGRQRYEQIRQWWNGFVGNPTVQRAAERGKELAGEAGRKGFHVVQQGVEKASGSVRNRLNGGDTPGELPADVGI